MSNVLPCGSADPMTSMPSIILVVPAYFPDSYGGAERQAFLLATALGQLGVDVTLIAPTIDTDAPIEEAAPFGRIIRKRLRAYPNFGGRHLLSFVRWTLWIPWMLRGSRWRHIPIYVFHARLHALGPALAAINLKSALLIKLGGGGEASEFAALRSKKFLYGHLVEKLLKCRTDMFVANSSQIVGELRQCRISQERIVEFSNGVELPSIERLGRAIDRRRGKRFIYMGRLVPDKRVDILFKAAMAIARNRIAINLTLIGDGPERERLDTLRRELDRPDVVSLPGFMSDVYAVLEQADFFVSASKREGQSNALLEAMSAGVIPIVYAASGVNEVVTHGVTGFIVDQSTSDAFRRAMEHALNLTREERLAMSLAARKFVQDNVGIEAIAERTLAAIGRAEVRRGRDGTLCQVPMNA